MEISHIEGAVTAEARSGNIELRDVSGEVHITAHTGTVSIESAKAGVRAHAHTGAIRYHGRVCGDFDIKANTGLIHLAVDPDFPFFVDAESNLGSVRSDLPPRRGGGRPNGSGPKVRLRTHTGAIRLTRA
jgi:hypothetical protein